MIITETKSNVKGQKSKGTGLTRKCKLINRIKEKIK